MGYSVPSLETKLETSGRSIRIRSDFWFGTALSQTRRETRRMFEIRGKMNVELIDLSFQRVCGVSTGTAAISSARKPELWERPREEERTQPMRPRKFSKFSVLGGPIGPIRLCTP
jgi:hypothetical protein